MLGAAMTGLLCLSSRQGSILAPYQSSWSTTRALCLSARTAPLMLPIRPGRTSQASSALRTRQRVEPWGGATAVSSTTPSSVRSVRIGPSVRIIPWPTRRAGGRARRSQVGAAR
jgi:hypothetical protein